MSNPPLTYIQQIWSNDTVMLHLNFSAVKNYVTGKNDYLECCYQEIIRAGEFTHADDKTNLTSCRSFDMVVELPAQAEFLLVNCKRISTKKKPETVYTNAHALVRRKPEVMTRFKDRAEKNGTKPLSVLLIGIDSISRLNLIRAMPNTAQYLYDTGWMELKGYNKVRFSPLKLFFFTFFFNFSPDGRQHFPESHGNPDWLQQHHGVRHL